MGIYFLFASFGIKAHVLQIVGRGQPHNQPRRDIDGRNNVDLRDPRNIEIERLQLRAWELEVLKRGAW